MLDVMKTAHKLAVYLMSAALSGVLGGCANPLEQRLLRSEAARAAFDLNVLRSIREGDTNRAIEKLEVDLNRSRVFMEMFMADETHPDTNYVRILERVRAYQEKHPLSPRKVETK